MTATLHFVTGVKVPTRPKERRTPPRRKVVPKSLLVRDTYDSRGSDIANEALR